jgi:Na+-transporting methylmalonyl-CoA/oxaloacetate decarboxylase gamma subunit
MQKKITSGIIIIVMLALMVSIPFIGLILPQTLIDELGIMTIFGGMGIVLIILIIVLIFINKLGKIKANVTHKVKPKVKKEPRIRPVKENKSKTKKEVIPKIDPKTKRKEIIQELKIAERQFLKNKIDKQTFDSISKTNNSELIKLEAIIDSKRKVDLTPVQIKRLDSVTQDKKKVLKDLLEQKQRKVHELQITEKSFYKRKIDDLTFKKISSEIKSEMISIEGKIKTIQQSSKIDQIKAELKKGALEVTKQRGKTEKRKTENELREEDLFEQIDDMVGGLKR